MSFGSIMAKFATILSSVAPMALAAAGLPPALGTAIVTGITAAQGMVGASNDQKAVQAATIAQASIAATNAILVSNGHPVLIDPTASTDALNTAIKMTYDIGQMLHTADGSPMPTSTAA